MPSAVSLLLRNNRTRKKQCSDTNNNKKLTRGSRTPLRISTTKSIAATDDDFQQLTRLVKERWPEVQKQLGPSPPVDRTDSGKRLALTATNYKYLEKLHFALQELVQSCKQSLQQEATQNEGRNTEDADSQIGSFCERPRMKAKDLNYSREIATSTMKYETDTFGIDPQTAASSHDCAPVPAVNFLSAFRPHQPTTTEEFEKVRCVQIKNEAEQECECAEDNPYILEELGCTTNIKLEAIATPSRKQEKTPLAPHTSLHVVP